MGSNRRTRLGARTISRLCVVALVSAPVGLSSSACVVELDDSVDAMPEVLGQIDQSLAVATLKSVNGTYGAGCVGRTGAWSVLVSGTDPLTNEPLSVVRNNTACELTITSIVADQLYTGTLAMTDAYAGSASAFSVDGSLAFYVNAKLSSTTFASTFTMTILASDNPGGGAGSDVQATSSASRGLRWFGDGTFSQGAYDLTPQYSPLQEGTNATTWSIAASNTAMLAAGVTNSCAIRSNGSLWCWGFDPNNTATIPATIPSQIGSVLTWNGIAVGRSHACATRTDGTLWCWGLNSSGQIGIGNIVSPQLSPIQVGTNTTWKGVAVGDAHTCATRTGGTLWCWGLNSSGQVGIGSVVTPQNAPVQIGILTTWATVTAGANHTCATRTDGTLWCWGLNSSGQVGNGGVVTPQNAPVQVGTLTTWSKVGAGANHTCATRTGGGTLWCWGRNSEGQVGIGSTVNPQNAPVQVGSNATWETVSGGLQHTCATRTGGTLWCWGQNANGQVGIGNTVTPQTSPVQVGVVTTWKSLAMGANHTCATRTDGTLRCWGAGAGGLGIGTFDDSNLPLQVGSDVSWSVAATAKHSCAIRTNGSLWCWGQNANGQVGIGNLLGPQVTPIQVGTALTWNSITVGDTHTCATRTNGSLWCWGNNNNSQVSVANALSPVQIGTNTTWNQVEAAFAHTCATRTDGTLWCWGRNVNGQIGNGTTSLQPTPLQIGTATTWRNVAIGGEHSCATRTDGTLWCWGQNTSGEVGIGNTTSPQSSPVQVGTGTSWSSVAAGWTHTCATQTNGTLWCWGHNAYLQLGSSGTYTSPRQVGTGTTWSSVALGFHHTCATQTDRTLWCWGRNEQGQLGIGSWTIQTTATPTRVGTGTVSGVFIGGSGSATMTID